MKTMEQYARLVDRAREKASGILGSMVREPPGALQEEKTPLTELLEFILNTAYRSKASDVHFEPLEQGIRIRLRINGAMKLFFQGMPWELYDKLVSRVKIICGLDIAEKRLPQDGRFSFAACGEGASLDVRASVVPTIHGEKIVLRLLNAPDSFKGLEQLDLSAGNLRLLREKCTGSSGMLLLAGPVNSGKTTTLYAVLTMLNQEGINIISVEDPVEYRIEGINQIQVNGRINFGFAEALHAVLRQDFDFLAVGEIRSAEAAEMLISSALTGRRVFATIHTPGAVKTIYRLLDMGIKPYLLAAAVSAVMGQRLVRRLCPVCREPYRAAPGSREAEFLGEDYDRQQEFFRHRAKGCPHCEHTGFAGRLAVQELLNMDGRLTEAVAAGVTAGELAKLAEEAGMVSMKQDGIKKAAAGQLELSELLEIL